MLSRREFSGLLLASLLSGRALASSAVEDDLARILEDHPNPAVTIMGQAAAGSAVRRAWGERALGSGIKVTTGDLWHVASVTKSMTALLAARLVEAQAIGWEDKIGKLLGAIAPDMVPQYRDASLRQLLTHRSGLRENISIFDYVRYRKSNPDAEDERRDYSRRALRQSPVGPAGSTFGYSNNGYIVAGTMMEVATGRSWEDLMREQVFAALDMQDAGFGPPGSAATVDQPRGHMRGLLGGRLRPISPASGNADNPAVMYPCGGVHLSLRDMEVYLRAHRDRPGLLGEESWRTLHTPPPGGDYAMGWFVRPDGRLEHGGWNRRWVALVRIDPATETIAFAGTNSGDRHNAHPAVEHGIHAAAVLAQQG